MSAFACKVCCINSIPMEELMQGIWQHPDSPKSAYSLQEGVQRVACKGWAGRQERGAVCEGDGVWCVARVMCGMFVGRGMLT
jgi:hypothetical protein